MQSSFIESQVSHVIIKQFKNKKTLQNNLDRTWSNYNFRCEIINCTISMGIEMFLIA